jgi:hypothetical protein
MLAPMTTWPRAVRRPRASAALAACLVLGLTGCAGIGQPAPYDSPGINGLVVPTPSPAPGDFVERVDNAWLPLEPGSTARFDVTEDGVDVGRIERRVLDRPTDVAGLSATGVTTVTDIGGTTGITTRYYAQDTAGNVWVVGADEGDRGSGEWRAGVDGAEAGLAMPADARLGDGWLTYDVPGLPRASTTIEDQSDTLVQTRDEADTTTRRVYEKGVGLVGIEDLDAGWTAELVRS